MKASIQFSVIVVMVLNAIGLHAPQAAPNLSAAVSIQEDNNPDLPTPLQPGPQPVAGDAEHAVQSAPDGWETMTAPPFALPDAQASEATFTVNSTADLPDSAINGVCQASNGLCTLRAAIMEANATSGADTITLPNGLYVIGSELMVTKPVTINGTSQANTIIDGNSNTRGFNFVVHSGAHTLANLTIQNAWNKSTAMPALWGGGIFSEATLTLRNVTVKNCRAAQGGGVYNQTGFNGNMPTLFLENVVIMENIATSTTLGYGGGGLFTGGRMNGTNVTIINNHANLQGGGLYVNSYASEIVLRNFKINGNVAKIAAGVDVDLTKIESGYGLDLLYGEVSGNRANCCPTGSDSGGAGIYNNEGITRLTNVAVHSNYVDNSGGFGAGIVNIQYMSLVNTSVVGNQATYGSGIFNGNYNNWPNSLTMVNTTISGNSGTLMALDSLGGGIFNTSVGMITGYNINITQNWAKYAGGIDNHLASKAIQLKNSILAGNTDNGNSVQDCYGAVTSLGNNIIGNHLGNPRIKFNCNYSSQATDQLGIVPVMGTLTGSPAYHPLVIGSTAVDRGVNTNCPLTDILGKDRPLGAACDIGPYELNSANLKFLYLPGILK